MEHNEEKLFGECLLCAGEGPGKITSATQQREKHLTHHPQKAFLHHPQKAFSTFIFALGISCDQIAKIIWARVGGG